MANQQAVDITELAVLGEQFPLRLMQLGFRLMQVMDAQRHDQYRYVLPPVCEVPAGPFLMGSDKELDSQAGNDELPQHPVTLDTYHIGAYPLTMAEYAYFVKARPYVLPDEWGWQQHHPDHPVVGVSWNDVMVYAHWLTRVTGERWRLPTEAEWEKAARGTDGRIYPWGNGFDKAWANTDESGIGTTTPVGSYPQGVSSYGCYDMVGNVWEWCSTRYRDYPYQGSDGREDDADTTSHRVLRGGSWYDNPRDVRVAYRSFDDPTSCLSSRGVRLVRGVRAG